VLGETLSPLPYSSGFFVCRLVRRDKVVRSKKPDLRGVGLNACHGNGAVFSGRLFRGFVQLSFCFFFVDEEVNVAGGFFEVMFHIFALHTGDQAIKGFDNPIHLIAADFFVFVGLCQSVLQFV
jgi:hypothetical protein